jgi:mannitol-specific phosphotransferase system IIBC component
MVSTRRSISSSSASASASGAANNNNNNNNNSNTLGFVPPTTLPGRKILRTRTMQHRKRRRQDLILVTISVAAAIVFVVPFVLFFYSKSDNSQQLIQQSNKIDAALNVVKQEKQKQKQKNLRGGEEERNIWVSQKSQPFNERGLAVHAENLVMVAGHSVTVSGHLQDADSDESDWFLLG